VLPDRNLADSPTRRVTPNVVYAGVLAALETLAVLMVKLPPVDPVLDGGKQMGCDRRLHDIDKQAEQADTQLTQTGSKKGFLG